MNCSELDELAGAIALRVLPEDESIAVAQHLATCPAGHTELDELRQVVALLPFSLDEVEPPASLRGSLIAAALADLDEPAEPPVTAEVIPFPRVAPPGLAASRGAVPAPADMAPRPLSVARVRRAWLSPSVLAAAALLVLSVGLSAWNLSLRNSLGGKTATNSQQARALTALFTAAQVVPLQSPVGLQATLVRSSAGEASLVLGHVPAAPAGKVYQAWFIGGNGPVSAGVFGGADDQVVALQGQAANGETVAVTVEPAGGSPQPTSSPIASAKIG